MGYKYKWSTNEITNKPNPTLIDKFSPNFLTVGLKTVNRTKARNAPENIIIIPISKDDKPRI